VAVDDLSLPVVNSPNEVVDACHVLADALDAAARYIVAQNAEGAGPLLKSVAMDLEQHVIGDVIEVAAEPLFAKVAGALAGLDWSGSGSAGRAPGRQLPLYSGAVRSQLAALRDHAVTMRGHGAPYATAVSELGS
jgi:hypothetical protein